MQGLRHRGHANASAAVGSPGTLALWIAVPPEAAAAARTSAGDAEPIANRNTASSLLTGNRLASSRSGNEGVFVPLEP